MTDVISYILFYPGEGLQDAEAEWPYRLRLPQQPSHPAAGAQLERQQPHLHDRRGEPHGHGPRGDDFYVTICGHGEADPHHGEEQQGEQGEPHTPAAWSELFS